MDSSSAMTLIMYVLRLISGADPGFQARGGGGGGGGGGLKNITVLRQKIIFFPILRGGGGGGSPGAPLWIRPWGINSETY